MRALTMVVGALIAALLIVAFGVAIASTCSDACETTYQACTKSCNQNDTDCFTKCLNDKGSCLAKCPG